MTKLYKSALFFTAIFCLQFLQAQDLVHYWNFNDNSSLAALTTPTLSYVPGASITAVTNGNTTIDVAGGTGQNFNVDNLNAQNGDPAGTHLRYNEPINGMIDFAIPTVGYEDITIAFASRRSGSGADDQIWSYSTDGTNFVELATLHPVDGNPTLQTLSLVPFATANNNASLKLRVTFAQGAGGLAGNNRFDNFTVMGVSTGGDTIAPIVTLTPTTASTNVALTVLPTISFNEDVRLADNSAITDANVDATVTLRLDNASGASVPFDATFAANTITITPSALINGQTYYVALLPDTIEDLSDNAATGVNATTFTTVAAQPNLANGDLVFVAYRASATAAEDEVAFLTLVDLPNGTNIIFTDSKYTSNIPAQCDGGLLWTSAGCLPAGSVVSLQTNAMVVSNGSLSGSGFGLSSNGDQVIAYTGTADTPNYITAMSTNGWIADNTSCGGSLSMLPAGLVDGNTSLNMSTAPGNVAGNTANAYYNGPQSGTYAFLRGAILDPFNWVTAAASTAAQTWPVWDFPTAVQVQSASAPDAFTVELTFSGDVDPTSGASLDHYTGIDGLTTASVSGNLVTLTYSNPFLLGTTYTLMVSGVGGTDGLASSCAYSFTFDGTLGTQNFSKSGHAFVIYPNPGHGVVNLNRVADIVIYDYSGKLLLQANQTKTIDTTGFANGIYLVRTGDGAVAKLLVR